MIGTAPARSFCIISWRTSPTYFSSLIVYRVFLCVVLFFCPFINVLSFIFKLFCCFCSIFQTMLFELQCSARALSQQSFLYIFAGFFFFFGLEQQLSRLSEGLSNVSTLAALSFIFSPILTPDHFQGNVFSLLIWRMTLT